MSGYRTRRVLTDDRMMAEYLCAVAVLVTVFLHLVHGRRMWPTLSPLRAPSPPPGPGPRAGLVPTAASVAGSEQAASPGVEGVDVDAAPPGYRGRHRRQSWILRFTDRLLSRQTTPPKAPGTGK